MTLTTSSNNNIKEWKETYLWSLKKNRGMMALLALLLFMAMPMILMIWLSSRNHSDQDSPAKLLLGDYTRFLNSVVPFLVTPLVLVFVVVITVSLFSYMHQKRSVDLFHALPIGRVPMLLARYCAGLTALFLPILLNFSIVCLIGAVHQVDMSKCLPLIISFMLWLMLMSTAALTFSMFMAVCTGTTLDMVLSILGVNAAYPLLIFSGSYFASSILPGLSILPTLNSTVLSALSPFFAAFLPYSGEGSYFRRNNGTADGPSGVFLAWWIIFTIILLVGSILLYKKRKSECAESNFAFPLPKIVIRFMITAVVGLGLGLVLGSATDNSANFFIGAASGSLAAHIVVEAIYSRGFKQLKKSFVYYGAFAAVFIVVYGVLATGAFGYDTRVPSADAVASIRIEAPFLCYDGNNYIQRENRTVLTEITPTLKEKENIDKMVALHQQYVTGKREAAFPYYMEKSNSARFTMEYQLKNGKTMKRSYFTHYTDTDTFELLPNNNDMLLRISELKEFRETSSMLFYTEPEYIKSVDIEAKGNGDSLTFAPDLSTKRELLEALRQDYLDGKIGDNKNNKTNPISLHIEYKYPIELKDGKLKELLGNSSGKIRLRPGNYTLTSSTGKTKELIKKLGWDK